MYSLHSLARSCGLGQRPKAFIYLACYCGAILEYIDLEMT